MRDDFESARRRAGRETAREADGHHEGIPARIGDFRIERNVYRAVEWCGREESVFCRQVGDEWQALVVCDGRTRTLLAGLGSKNHALWLAREYMEFGETYDDRDVWSELPSRERSNPFRDVIRRSEDAILH